MAILGDNSSNLSTVEPTESIVENLLGSLMKLKDRVKEHKKVLSKITEEEMEDYGKVLD